VRLLQISVVDDVNAAYCTASLEIHPRVCRAVYHAYQVERQVSVSIVQMLWIRQEIENDLKKTGGRIRSDYAPHVKIRSVFDLSKFGIWQ